MWLIGSDLLDECGFLILINLIIFEMKNHSRLTPYLFMEEILPGFDKLVHFTRLFISLEAAYYGTVHYCDIQICL